MHEEAGFLSVIRQSPADDTARLVFADWLDEQDDPNCKTKADFIRLELRIADAPEQNHDQNYGRNQLRRLAKRIDPLWLTVISNPKLETYQVTPSDACPKQWKRLTPTATPELRHCEVCRTCIPYCGSLEETRSSALNGTCVALALALTNRASDLSALPALKSRRLAPKTHERKKRQARWLDSRENAIRVIAEPVENRFGARGRWLESVPPRG
ncbi:TIGR02996 domain-containing protein [Gemmata sp. G18]|uniref:TIGR02996 domain-containing protein n=1 Tax=Gemmata palustris TaxID=2822762 RepID=A0ABS5BU37_9BACT|nr:TIGR02996 domain-containing protein [Gemmata palustris]MBP3957239.1 TIGR02996 domain-containing protein [Gemmata palustris]